MKKKRTTGGPSFLSRMFGLDLRSLAAFRIGVAAFILFDLASRAFDLTAHYTDAGILPRQWTLQYYSLAAVYQSWNPALFSVHMLTGTALGTGVLFAIHALSAIGLLLGYRTRLMTIIVWYLLASLHTRNPLVLSVGDDVVRTLLFFAIWLPIGARYSIDAALNTEKSENKTDYFASVPTAAFFIQFICIYFFSALLKSGAEWRTDGTALYYAFSFDQFALPAAKALLGFPRLLKAMTFAAWWVELIAGFILLIPYSMARMAGILLVAMLQVGIGLTLSLGHNPWINCIVLLAFVPSSVWDWKRSSRPVEIIFDGNCGFCRKLVFILEEFLQPALAMPPHIAEGRDLATLRRENSWIVRDQRDQEFFRFDAFIRVIEASPIVFWMAPALRLAPVRAIGTAVYRQVADHRPFLGKLLSPLRFKPLRVRTAWWSDTIALLCVAAVVIYNTANIVRLPIPPDIFRIPALMLRLEQYWGMFAPSPNRDDGWYVFEGRLRNGSRVEAFRGNREPDEQKPASAGEFYPNERWRRYMINIGTRDLRDFRNPLAGYLCANWNQKHSRSDHLEGGSIVFVRERTPPPGQSVQLERLDLNDFECGP